MIFLWSLLLSSVLCRENINMAKSWCWNVIHLEFSLEHLRKGFSWEVLPWDKPNCFSISLFLCISLSLSSLSLSLCLSVFLSSCLSVHLLNISKLDFAGQLATLNLMPHRILLLTFPSTPKQIALLISSKWIRESYLIVWPFRIRRAFGWSNCPAGVKLLHEEERFAGMPILDGIEWLPQLKDEGNSYSALDRCFQDWEKSVVGLDQVKA